MQLSRPQLTVLLNALVDAGDREITVSHPSDAIDALLTIDLDAVASIEPISASEYSEARSAINSEFGSPAVDELPDQSAYLNGLMAGGLIEPPNRDDIDEFLARYGSPDLTAGHKPVVAGFDANLLGWRIADVLNLTPEQDGIINGFALATGVRDELNWDAKRSDTRPLEVAFGHEFEELWNQPAGDRRQGRLAETYYRQLRDHRYAEEVVTDRGDEAIVSGYEQFQADSRKEVLLFSNDRDFVERARSHRVLGQWVELPQELPSSIETSWDDVCNTLYVFAIMFGVLVLPKVTIYGVWRGKEGQAWENEAVKIDCRSPKVESMIQRDLDIISPG